MEAARPMAIVTTSFFSMYCMVSNIAMPAVIERPGC
ncbi:hypothetical protein SGLAM104S_06178 [Streptomyces glaucescens]